MNKMEKRKFLYARCIKNEDQWVANLYAEDNPRYAPLDILSGRTARVLILSIEIYARSHGRELISITLLYKTTHLNPITGKGWLWIFSTD